MNRSLTYIVVSLAIFALPVGTVNAQRPDGISYAVDVQSSFGTEFSDCFIFGNDGVLTVLGLGIPQVYEQKDLGKSKVFWQSVPFSGFGFSIAFSGTATGARGLSQIELPVTFEDRHVDYSLSDFGGTVSVVRADPVDTKNTVAATTKTAGSPFFAGTVIGRDFDGFANPIPFTATETEMTLRVLSPAAGINVKLKVENAVDGNIFAEVDVLTTVANGWETMRFDFAGAPGFYPSIEYSKAVIFFDFVVNKPGDGSVYYWDDLALGDLGNAATSAGGGPTVTTNKDGTLKGNAISEFGDTFTFAGRPADCAGFSVASVAGAVSSPWMQR